MFCKLLRLWVVLGVPYSGKFSHGAKFRSFHELSLGRKNKNPRKSSRTRTCARGKTQNLGSFIANRAACSLSN